MDRLGNAILRILKGSSIPNAVLFSDQDVNQEPPYVIVRPSNGILDRTRRYRIMVYHQKGFSDALEDYVLNELDSLLLSGYIEDEDGGRYKLYPSGYTDLTPIPEENVYFMERIYYTPFPIR